MTGSIRIVLTAMALLIATPALASELSPWFGSTDQTAFQLDPNTMVAVTFAADPLQTGSLSKPGCVTQGCATAARPAINQSASGGVPQK